jgi:hypothetical protein
MPRGSSLTLPDSTVLGLFFIQRYRFLTIDQFARASNLNRSTASDQLRFLERFCLLGHFGNTGLAGHGKTPKAYFLTRKGWEVLLRESDIPPELIGNHKEIKVEARWSPQMYHRLRTVDLMISAEVAVRSRPHLSMVRTFLEYRRVKRGTRVARETTDYVDKEETAENRIVPDAAFIMENIDTKRRALFFVEMDMATERIVSHITRDNRMRHADKALLAERRRFNSLSPEEKYQWLCQMREKSEIYLRSAGYGSETAGEKFTKVIDAIFDMIRAFCSPYTEEKRYKPAHQSA